MQIVRDPSQFDVLVTSNMFGDILSDEASVITGSIGMLPSASLGASAPAGSTSPSTVRRPTSPAGTWPIPSRTILSAAMMLRHSFGLEEEALAVEAAVSSVLARASGRPTS